VEYVVKWVNHEAASSQQSPTSDVMCRKRCPARNRTANLKPFCLSRLRCTYVITMPRWLPPPQSHFHRGRKSTRWLYATCRWLHQGRKLWRKCHSRCRLHQPHQQHHWLAPLHAPSVDQSGLHSSTGEAMRNTWHNMVWMRQLDVNNALNRCWQVQWISSNCMTLHKWWFKLTFAFWMMLQSGTGCALTTALQINTAAVHRCCWYLMNLCQGCCYVSVWLICLQCSLS